MNEVPGCTSQSCDPNPMLTVLKEIAAELKEISYQLRQISFDTGSGR